MAKNFRSSQKRRDRGRGVNGRTTVWGFQNLNHLPLFDILAFPCLLPSRGWVAVKSLKWKKIQLGSGAWVRAKLLQSCCTLCHPMDCSPPGSSAHGILQARILEWVAISSSRGSSWPKDWTRVSCSSCIAGRFFTAEPPGKPSWILTSHHIQNELKMHQRT